MRKLWFALFAGLLTACSSSDKLVMDSFRTWETRFPDVTELSAQLRSAQISPVPLNRLAFQMASLERSNRIEITADSPIVSFPEGNSFVAALFLPEHINRFTFALESKAGRTVFVPSVIFLNENLQQVARIDDAKFNGKGFFSIEKTFTEEVAQSIRYMLVYSEDRDLDGRSELVDPIREYELKKGKDLPETSYPKFYSKHSPIGHLNIRFEDVFFSAEAIHNKLVIEGSKQNKTKMFVTPSIVEAPTILSDTEAFYLQQISKALKEGNDLRAKKLVEEAERAGSTKAESHYMEEVEKQRQ